MARLTAHGDDPLSAARTDQRAPAATTGVHYRVLAIGCALALITYLQRQAFVRAMPDIQADLGLSTQQMGYLASAFLVAYGLFQVPYGLLGDRLGPRHVLTLLVVTWSTLTAATALVGMTSTTVAADFALLFGVRFLFGAFQSGGFPVWARVMTDWIPLSERASGQGIIWMFSRLGGAVSPFVFLWLYQSFDTWRTPLVILGLLGLAWCLVFWPWFRNRPNEMRQVNVAELALIDAGRQATHFGHAITWRALVRSRSVWALCVMYGFVGFSGNFITNLLPVYLANVRQLSAEATTWLTGLPLAFGIISCALGGVLSDWLTRRWSSPRWGRRVNGSVGLALAGLALVTVPWVEATWSVAALLTASFFCNDLNMAPAWAACADVGRSVAGTVSGAMNMTGNFAGAIGMALAGRLLEKGQAHWVFIIFAASYAMAALCWLAVDVTKPVEAELPEQTR